MCGPGTAIAGLGVEAWMSLVCPCRPREDPDRSQALLRQMDLHITVTWQRRMLGKRSIPGALLTRRSMLTCPSAISLKMHACRCASAAACSSRLCAGIRTSAYEEAACGHLHVVFRAAPMRLMYVPLWLMKCFQSHTIKIVCFNQTALDVAAGEQLPQSGAVQERC